MKLSCIIVDDEPLAHKVLTQHISKIDALELIDTFESGTDAINYLVDHQVDVVFLDIQMEDLTGFEVIQSLTEMPLVVLTTAYSQYALKGYEFIEVVDYLMKPISFLRFIQAFKKVHSIKDRQRAESSEKKSDIRQSWTVKADHDIHKLKLSDVIYIQAWGNYIKIRYNDQTLVTAKTMKEVEDELPASVFLRAHKSYILNKNHIRKVSGNRVEVKGEMIPIGISYKQKLLNLLNQ